MASTHSFRLAWPPAGKATATVQVAVKAPPVLKGWVRAALQAALPRVKAYQGARWQINIRLCGTAEATAANTTFRHKTYTPDVLSFPLWEANTVGDILLCWPVVQAHAKAQGKPLKAHLQHLVVHGLLHLAGEDHQTPAQATQMEAQEIAILATLGWPNPYEID